jgi:hypothetical protein
MARSTSKTAPEISSYPVYTKMTMVFHLLFVIFYLKGESHEINASVLFHETSSPKPLKIAVGSCRDFLKIRGDIRKSRCTRGISDTGGKIATGVNDTGGKFAAGVNYTGGKFATDIKHNGGKFSHR